MVWNAEKGSLADYSIWNSSENVNPKIKSLKKEIRLNNERNPVLLEIVTNA